MSKLVDRIEVAMMRADAFLAIGDTDSAWEALYDAAPEPGEAELVPATVATRLGWMSRRVSMAITGEGK